jgi:hypothetical protein
MPRKNHKAEEFVSKLRHVAVLAAQGIRFVRHDLHASHSRCAMRCDKERKAAIGGTPAKVTSHLSMQFH